jgi:hypothetical protein
MVYHNSAIPTPDWKTPKAVVLVWPEQIHRKYLNRLYAQLSKYIPENIKLFYIIKDRKIKKRLIDSVHKYNPKVTVNCIEIPEVTDIWIRDWAPILAVNEAGIPVLIKAIYWPRYLVKNVEKQYIAFERHLPKLLNYINNNKNHYTLTHLVISLFAQLC